MTRSYKGVLEPFAQGLGRFLGLIEDKGVRDQIRPVIEEAVKRSPIQDAMNQAGAIRMGVREIPQVPGQAPKPEGFGGFKPVPNPPTSKVPLQQGPVRMEPGFTRGGSQGVQLQPGAIEPRAAERFEVDNQLRIPFTQPGRGGQMYSPLKSAENPEVAGQMMRSRLGDVLDAADFPRFRGAEGQRAMDLEPSVTREMMQRMAPSQMVAPSLPERVSPAGLQMTDLSGINPRDLAILAGAAGTGAVLGTLGTPTTQPVSESVQEGPAVGAVGPTSGQPTSESLTPAEAASLNNYISDIINSSAQNPGALNDVIKSVVPRSPEMYSSPEAYRADIGRFITGISNGNIGELGNAVGAIRSGAITDPESPLISEQTPESVTTQSVGSALGTDNAMNAVGQAQAAGDNVTLRGADGELTVASEVQGNNEIIDATRPIISSQLQRTQDFLTEQALSMGADSTAPVSRMADPSRMAYIMQRIASDTQAARDAGMSDRTKNMMQNRMMNRSADARAFFDSRYDYDAR